jgi:hypothetical protein
MALQTISGGGVFSRLNISQINSNFNTLANPDLWVRPQNTSSNAAPDGTYERPYASVTAAAPYFQPGMVVGLLGVLRDEFTAPLGVNDITIRGMGTKPRQATTSGVANGGGATWLSPLAGATSTTTPLINVRAQGWTFENLFFNNSATAAPCVMLTTSGTGDPPADPDASHASFHGCWFTGADDGISSTGLPNFVTIDGCTFFGFADATDIAISYAVGGGVKTLYGWTIKNNEFWGNARHIIAALSGASIHHNHFSYINNGVTTSIFYDATNGKDNAVFENAFDVNSGNAGIAAMFVLGTNDRFSANSLSTAVATTQFSWGDPA